MQHTAFISCPKGIEALLKDELASIGKFELSKQRVGGLLVTAEIETLYRSALWSRLANRVLLQLDSAAVSNKDQLRDWLMQQNWSQHISTTNSLYIRYFGELAGIQHSQYGAQFVKDAIVDYFRQRDNQRPDVDKDNPDLRFQVNIERQQALLYLDLSGESLHQRGYRQGITAAPLKENLAAALLIRAQWPAIAATGGALIDPLCGSGTLLTEAALMAANIAPGLLRTQFGFHHWLQHDDQMWQSLLNDAKALCKQDIPPIIGYDDDKRALGVAEQHIAALNLGAHAPRVYFKNLSDWKKPSHIELKSGLLISNPPYGERLGTKSNLVELYQTLGSKWRSEFPSWQAALFTSDETLAKATQLFWNKNYKFYNGQIECQLYLFDLSNERKRSGTTNDNVAYKLSKTNASNIEITPFVQRLQKNQQRLKGWLKQHTIECYRIYYADIPEFSVAIDIYQDWALVQEFQAPKTIDEKIAKQRLSAIIKCLPDTLNIPIEKIILKQRKRQKGKSQYEKADAASTRMKVKEGNVQLWVDLHNYLDSGLFLDHRPLRLKLAKLCPGKRLLNLFSYTAAATVHAAVGIKSKNTMNGALLSVSVDLSNTYLDWARQNYRLNNIDLDKHHLLQANIMQWIQQHQQLYDIIFLDPPTFSNSKRMDENLDIQRDHVFLIQQAMRCLDSQGTLFFSCNFRKFKLDAALEKRFEIRNITSWSIPRDFSRPSKIHHCFEIQHRKPA